VKLDGERGTGYVLSGSLEGRPVVEPVHVLRYERDARPGKREVGEGEVTRIRRTAAQLPTAPAVP